MDTNVRRELVTGNHPSIAHDCDTKAASANGLLQAVTLSRNLDASEPSDFYAFMLAVVVINYSRCGP
jgi:hypothetical protein